MLPGLQVVLQDYPCCRLVNTAHCQCSQDCRLHYRTIHVADWLTLHIVNAPWVAGCITGLSMLQTGQHCTLSMLPGLQVALQDYPCCRLVNCTLSVLPGLQVALQDYPCCRLVNTAHCQCSLDCRLHYRTIHVADWLTLHIVNAPWIAGCITGLSMLQTG